jgi:hypothetical protein
MNLDRILAYVRGMRDRDGLKAIINAAEARDSKLSSIDGERERARLWKRFEHLKKGDMVFIHAKPRERNATSQHLKLWAKPLTVREVKVRVKEIVVRAPGSTVDHRLSPFTCDRLKLSTEVCPAALHAGLMERAVAVSAKPKRRRTA